LEKELILNFIEKYYLKALRCAVNLPSISIKEASPSIARIIAINIEATSISFLSKYLRIVE